MRTNGSDRSRLCNRAVGKAFPSVSGTERNGSTGYDETVGPFLVRLSLELPEIPVGFHRSWFVIFGGQPDHERPDMGMSEAWVFRHFAYSMLWKHDPTLAAAPAATLLMPCHRAITA
ncbi:hypothetical protein [Sphingomonas sp. UYP23]